MQQDLIQVDPHFLAKWNRSIPRYTSYPTAPQFKPIEEGDFKQKLQAFDRSQKPLSLYLHIPFCKTMCLFCGCSVVLNRSEEKQANYLQHLVKEIALTAQNFSRKRKVSQLHLGGGTPTSLNEKEFALLMGALHRHFELEKTAEISIEIDPRTVYADEGKKLETLKRLGFNRVSFGVQDLDPLVQEAIRRRQSEEMTVKTYYRAREIGFQGINIDLIYGLPHQTPRRFSKTVDKLLELKPDRIAFYSYAKVPWLKPHQKAIPDESLPSTEEKFQIYVETRGRLMQNGYIAIGMDHFALQTDSIAEAYQQQKLTRNFQGYAVQLAEDMIGFGITAIGYIQNTYFQNGKEISDYQSRISQGVLPVQKGFFLQEDDLRRRYVIQSLMCHFSLDKREFFVQFQVHFDLYFADAKMRLQELQEEGFLEETQDQIIPTAKGRLFIRLIASVFDAYLQQGNYSKAI